MTPATYNELARTLNTLHLGIGAAELHGSLTGFLCAGGLAHRGSWLHELALDEVEDALGDAPERAVFDRLFTGCTAELDNPDLSFSLMLPDDDAPLGDRAGALVDWCRGFLGGLGLTGVDLKQALGEETDEILRDFGRIAATEVEADDDVEEDEEAYAEVVEYVRVGVMLLRNHLAGFGDPGATRH